MNIRDNDLASGLYLYINGYFLSNYVEIYLPLSTMRFYHTLVVLQFAGTFKFIWWFMVKNLLHGCGKSDIYLAIFG